MAEEINRIVTVHLSDLLFCPTETSVKDLVNEGNTNRQVQVKNPGYPQSGRLNAHNSRRMDLGIILCTGSDGSLSINKVKITCILYSFVKVR